MIIYDINPPRKIRKIVVRPKRKPAVLQNPKFDFNVFHKILAAILIFSLASFLSLFPPEKAYAATDYYINRDCANNGDGSSWSCSDTPGGAGAFNNIPADISCVFNGYSWVRGSTYWVAGSDTAYGTGCFRLNNGTGTITLKKASESSHGTDTGWQSSYGTKQAVLGQISINISNVTIDGSYRTTAESGYGFKIQAAGTTNLISNPNNTVTTGTTIKYVEATHTSFNTSSASAIQLYGNGGNLIQYVYTHDLSGLCFVGVKDPVYHTTSGFTDTTIEESVCGNIGLNTGASHVELLKDNGSSTATIIRNNLFYNWGDSSSTGGLILSDGQTNWSIYNNIFTERSEDGTCGNGVISGLTAGSGWTGIKVYNNTFANISSACSQVFATGLGDFSGAGNEVKNNLFYNTTVTTVCSGGCTKSTNWFYTTPNYTPSGDDISGAANPFVDSVSENFHLALGSSPINAGLDLSSIFTIDKDGITRPVGAWDIGAYEYVASSAKAITSFNFNGLTPAVTGTVNEGAKTVSLTVPYGTNVTALVPTIVHTGSSISPNTGVAQNFTSPVTYTATAEDASTQEYVVTVTVAPGYTIGGTISGLTGTVILQNNSGDNLNVTTSPFTFATALGDSVAYAVTVFTQPTGQTCTVSNGSGTVASANITNVSVSCSNDDSTAPVRSAGSPSGSQSAGTTQVTLSLTTDENATCKYSTSSGTVYASMTDTFSTTGGTSHSSTISGLSNGNSYNYYVRCTDETNINSDDYAISFSVASPASSGGGGGSPAIWTLPTVPQGGFKVSINSEASVTSNRNVTLNFNAGADIKKMAISMTGDFTDASQEDYTQTKQWDLCSKFGGSIKNLTCPNGTYTVYVQFYTAYGRTSASAMASSSITLNSNTINSPAEVTTDTNQQNTTEQPFAKPLKYGMYNADVKRLQIFLNQDPETRLDNKWVGSPGHETNFFGPKTWAAVRRFQEKYGKDILSPWGLIRGTGFVGKTTLAKINELISKIIGQ